MNTDSLDFDSTDFVAMEEAHYYSTINDFNELINSYPISKIWYDLNPETQEAIKDFVND